MSSILGWMAGWPAECFPSGKDYWKTGLLEKSLIAMMKGELVVFSCFQGKQNKFSTSSVIKFVSGLSSSLKMYTGKHLISLHYTVLETRTSWIHPPRLWPLLMFYSVGLNDRLSQEHVHGIPTKFSALTLSLLFSHQISGSFFPSSMKVQRSSNLTTFSWLGGIMRVSGNNGHSWIWYSTLQWQNQALCLNNTMMLWGWHHYLRAMIKFV